MVEGHAISKDGVGAGAEAGMGAGTGVGAEVGVVRDTKHGRLGSSDCSVRKRLEMCT